MASLCPDSMILHRANRLRLAPELSVNFHCEYTEAGESLNSGETVSDPVNCCNTKPHMSLDKCLCPQKSGWQAVKNQYDVYSDRVFMFIGHCVKQCLIIIVCT